MPWLLLKWFNRLKISIPNKLFHFPTFNLQARILESRKTLVHPHSKNKSDFTDLIFSGYVLQASYQLKTLNIVNSSNWQLKT